MTRITSLAAALCTFTLVFGCEVPSKSKDKEDGSSETTIKGANEPTETDTGAGDTNTGNTN